MEAVKKKRGMENLSIRFDDITLERLMNLRRFVQNKYTAKENTTRSDVIRTAILIGLQSLEREKSRANLD